jgi:hypothetical protein
MILIKSYLLHPVKEVMEWLNTNPVKQFAESMGLQKIGHKMYGVLCSLTWSGTTLLSLM